MSCKVGGVSILYSGRMRLFHRRQVTSDIPFDLWSPLIGSNRRVGEMGSLVSMVSYSSSPVDASIVYGIVESRWALQAKLWRYGHHPL